MRSGGCAGSGRALRLDPFGLPVRFSASDVAADGRVRDVELHRERVVLRRSLSGMRMALNMPVTAYDGISLRLVPGEGGTEDVLAVVLKHSDPALTLPLFVHRNRTRRWPNGAPGVSCSACLFCWPNRTKFRKPRMRSWANSTSNVLDPADAVGAH